MDGDDVLLVVKSLLANVKNLSGSCLYILKVGLCVSEDISIYYYFGIRGGPYGLWKTLRK